MNGEPQSYVDDWGTEDDVDVVLDEAQQVGGLAETDAYTQGAVNALATRLGCDGTKGRRATQALRLALVQAEVPISEIELWLAMGRRAARDPARRVLSVEELLATSAPVPLVDGMLNSGETAMLYGMTGAGKTFLALDLCAAVATGQPFAGRDTTRQRVIYVAAEGVGGLAKRLRALQNQRGPVRGLLIDRDAVNLMDAAEVQRAISRWRHDRPGLVVIDTLACSMVGGDENLARDIAVVIASMNRIRTALGVTVLVVHHTGKNSPVVERGSSALRSGLDTVMLVRRDGTAVSLLAEKQRNLEPFQRVNLALTRRGESLVVSGPGQAPAPGPSARDDVRAAAEQALQRLARGGQTPATQTVLIAAIRAQGCRGRTADVGAALALAAADPANKIRVEVGPRKTLLYDLLPASTAVPIPSPSKEGEGESVDGTASQ